MCLSTCVCLVHINTNTCMLAHIQAHTKHIDTYSVPKALLACGLLSLASDPHTLSSHYAKCIYTKNTH